MLPHYEKNAASTQSNNLNKCKHEDSSTSHLKAICPLERGKYKFLYSKSTTNYSDSLKNRQFFVKYMTKP